MTEARFLRRLRARRRFAAVPHPELDGQAPLDPLDLRDAGVRDRYHLTIGDLTANDWSACQRPQPRCAQKAPAES